MSPEQATGEQHVGPPSDVYALGCVLYEMLVYLQAPDETRIHSLRVIPGWVDEMKAAVEAAANR